MEIFFSRLMELKGSQSTAAFARSIGIPQPSMDRYLKGRVPTVEVVKLLCSVYNVSADWLLGLPERSGGITQQATANGPGGHAVAVAHGSVVISPGKVEAQDCSTCKYKRLAEVIKAAL